MNNILKIVLVFLIFTSYNSYSQQIKKNPEGRISSSELTHNLQKNDVITTNLDLNSIVNIDKSGDASLSVPIINVKGRQLRLPINISYRAGVKVNQKSSDVGLGWNINFGSIVRDYGAYEPDYAESTAEVKMESTLTGVGSGVYSVPGTYLNPFNNQLNIIYNGISESIGTEKQKMTPDDYHLNVPNLGGATFWNNGNPNGTLDFIFNNFQPWKIDYSTKIFEIDQEYSRINELTFTKQLSGVLSGTGNFAAAIAIPPYVQDREFGRGGGYIPGDEPSNANISNPLEFKVKYKDFEKFTITAEDGTKYVFGRALRGQKYLFTENPFWSTHGLLNSQNTSITHGEYWKIDYIAEWLLTEIYSNDYVDSNDNGIPDDEDEGDWIKIEYTLPTKGEDIPGSHIVDYINVPNHREWLNFTQTDRYSSLMRERAYVTKIVTPIQEILFESSPRMDVDHDYFETILNNPDGGESYYYSKHGIADGGNAETPLYVDYPSELKKYDKIIIREKIQDDALYQRNKVTNTIVFNYAEKGSQQELAVSNYLIRDNTNQENIFSYDPAVPGPHYVTPNGPNIGFNIEDYDVSNSGYNNGIGRGKTTLLGIDIYSENNTTTTDKRTYKFEYGANPSFDEIHKFEILKANGYPTIRESKINSARRALPQEGQVKTSLLPYKSIEFTIYNYNSQYSVVNNIINEGIDEMGYYYNSSMPNNGRDAWSLTKIVTPTGGSLELEYELDDFDYVNDRSNWSANQSIIDDELPHVSHYNKIIIAKNLLQSELNQKSGLSSSYYKKLNHTYSMPMNQNTGGLRLKKLMINDGINPVRAKKYEYGKGHYSSVPNTYWNNFIYGFSSLIQNENANHAREITNNYHPYFLPGQPYSEGFYNNDFQTYTAGLSINIRVGNNVDDNHYYEYIDEILEFDLNNSNPTIRKEYGSPFTSGATYYDKQNRVLLKGYEFWRDDVSPITELITNHIDEKHEIFLLKESKFEGGSLIPYESLEYDYSILNSLKNEIRYKSQTLANYYTPGYAIISRDNNSGWHYPPQSQDLEKKFMYYANAENTVSAVNPIFGSSGHPENQFLLSTFPNVISPVNNPFLGLENTASAIAQFLQTASNYDVYRVTDNGYSFSDISVPSKLSSIIKLTKKIKEYKSITTETEYTYEPTYNLLKTTISKNSKYYNTSQQNQTSPQIINETIYAFEDYNGISTKFIDRNMLSQVSQNRMYTGSSSNSNLLKASVQTWDVSVDPLNLNKVPRPKEAFVFNGTINNNGSLLNFVPFDFTSIINDEKWQLQSENKEYNQFGQLSLSKTNNLLTRNVLGYNSSLPKAIISSPGKKFDATYTGFEDHYDNNITYDKGTRIEEEFWYDQNDFDDSFTDFIAIAALREDKLAQNNVTYPICTSYNYEEPSSSPIEYWTFFIDNSDLALKVGDVITIRPNPNLPTTSSVSPQIMAQWINGQQSLDPFTTTIESIENLNPLLLVPNAPAPSFVASFHLFPGFDPNNTHRHMLCFSDDIPYSWKYLMGLTPANTFGNPNYLNGMIIEKAPEPRDSRITSTESHTGNSSYYLSHKKVDGDTQKTPVRPVKINKLGE
jgi:hypothetical protein